MLDTSFLLPGVGASLSASVVASLISNAGALKLVPTPHLVCQKNFLPVRRRRSINRAGIFQNLAQLFGVERFVQAQIFGDAIKRGAVL